MHKKVDNVSYFRNEGVGSLANNTLCFISGVVRLLIPASSWNFSLVLMTYITSRNGIVTLLW